MNFLNGTSHLLFLGLNIIILGGISRYQLGSWIANSIEPCVQADIALYAVCVKSKAKANHFRFKHGISVKHQEPSDYFYFMFCFVETIFKIKPHFLPQKYDLKV